MFVPQNAPRRSANARLTTYSSFRGVDFSTEAVSVSRNRLAYGQNFLIDNDGFPEKRPGTRTLLRIPSFDANGDPDGYDTATVYGIFRAKFQTATKSYVFAGDKVYLAEDGFTALVDMRENGQENYWYYQAGGEFGEVECHQIGNNVYFATGNGYFVDDILGQYFAPVSESENIYIPTTTINRLPSGGGEQFEDINILTPMRKNTFVADGTSTKFVFDGMCMDGDSVRAEINGEITNGYTFTPSAAGSGIETLMLSAAYVKLASSNSYSATTTYLEAGKTGSETYAISAMYFGDMASLSGSIKLYLCRQDTYAAHTLTVSAAPSYSSTGTVLTTFTAANGAGTWTEIDLTDYISTIRENPWLKISHGSGSSWSSFYKTGTNAPYVVTGIDSGNAYITFADAPASGDGIANVVIQYAAEDSETAQEKRRQILSASHMAEIVYGNGKYYLLANGDTDYQSGLDDPTYFPDRGYCTYGKGQTIKGYASMGDTVCVFIDNPYGSTVYLRNVIESGGEPIFPAAVTPGAQGDIIISGATIDYVNGDPLALTRNGIYSLTSLNVASKTVLRNRSYFLNGKLKQETFTNPVACVWNNRYILSVNGNAYVLDGNLSKSYPSTVNDIDYSYEATYWTNINAACFCVADDACYFGTPDGRLKRFNTDIEGAEKYNDDGAAIVTIMSTRVDDDGDFMMNKTMRKQGSGIMVKPFTQSSVEVYLTTREVAGTLAKQATTERWYTAQADGLYVITQDSPDVVPFLKKEKKYITLQITVQNSKVNEGFGVIGIIKRFETVNYVKR